MPLRVVAAGRAARLGPRRDRGRAAAASGGPGSGCAAGTRRPTSPSPTPSSTPSRRPGIATVPADARRAGYADGALAGPPRAGRGRRRAARSSSTAPTTRPARRPRPGARRPPAVPRRRAERRRRRPLTLVIGDDGRQGRGRDRPRRWRAGRAGRTHASSAPSVDAAPGAAAPADLAALWRVGRPGRPTVGRRAGRRRRARAALERTWPRGRAGRRRRLALSRRRDPAPSSSTIRSSTTCGIRPMTASAANRAERGVRSRGGGWRRRGDAVVRDLTGGSSGLPARPAPTPDRPAHVRAGASGRTSWGSST